MKIRPIILTCLIAFVFEATIFGQATADKAIPYLSQKSPGMTPVIFAPGLVSLKDQYEFGSVFSADGKEFFYAVDSGGKTETRFMQLKNGRWTKPLKLLTNEKYSYNDPCISPDGKRFYFISDRPMDGTGEKKDYDIWYIQRRGDAWSAPVNAGKEINTGKNEYYISFTKNGTMYFASNVAAGEDHRNNYDIYSARQKQGVFQHPLRLGDAINTVEYEADTFIALDESYIIFCSERPGGYGRGDLYISFKSPDGTWAKAKNMGPEINTNGYEMCPFVSADGKYLFYSGNRDIYWVDAKIINTLR